MRRIVIDTNCLLVILPSLSPYHKVWTDFLDLKLEICVSNEILTEYEEILSRKTSPFFAESIIKVLINKPNLIRISPAWRFHLIDQDPDDNKFIECALDSECYYIVSGDKDLLTVEEYEGVQIVTVTEFLQILKEE